MASCLKQSSEIEAMIDEVKTLMFTVYNKIFEREYDSLYLIAYDIVNDPEAAKNILDESLNETVVALLEFGFQQFKPAEIKNNFKHRITESCQKYIDESVAEKEFQLLHGQNENVDIPIEEEEIIKAVYAAFDKLPPVAKKIYYETLLTGSTRKVAENNNLERKTVLKMNWKAKKLLRKAFKMLYQKSC